MEKILIRKANKKVVVPVKEILYLEAKGRYTELILANNEKHVSAKCLKEYELLLHQHQFCRIHRKYLINLQFLSEFSHNGENKVVLSTGHHLPVSERKRQSVLFQIKSAPMVAFSKT